MSKTPDSPNPQSSKAEPADDGLVEVPAHVVVGILLGLVILSFLAYRSLVRSEVQPSAEAPPVAPVAQAPAKVLPPVDAVLRDSTTVKDVQELRGLPQGRLEQLVREGTPLQRTSALSVLWARGQRDLVRGMAPGDKLLEAQLSALEDRAP